jgi:malonate transporter
VILGMNMLVENLLLIPLLLALADSAGGGGHWRGVLRGVAVGLWRNPLVLGLAVGLAASLLGLRLPQPVERTVGLLAQSSAALSLFVIGGSLAGLRLAGMGRTVARIAAGKLLVHPLLTVGALALLAALGAPLADPALKKGVVLATACPMFGIYPILAGRFGEEGLAAAALLGTTVASFFSISALLWWLG